MSDTTRENVERVACLLAFVANRKGLTVKRCEQITNEAAAILRAILARAEAAEAALERDRSQVATALSAFSDAFARRSWLLEGRGPYEWDDPRYRDEFGAAYEELGAALNPLKSIARDWSNCPKTQEEVQAARMDWKARAEAAEAERDALQAKLALAGLW